MSPNKFFGTIEAFPKYSKLTKHQRLTKENTIFGRNTDCDVRLIDKLVARHHCILEVISDLGTVRIRDLNSSKLRGSILINGVVKKDAILCHNDVFSIIGKEFRFLYPVESLHHPENAGYTSPSATLNQEFIKEPKEHNNLQSGDYLSGNTASGSITNSFKEKKSAFALNSEDQLNKNLPSTPRNETDIVKQKNTFIEDYSSILKKKKVSFGPKLFPEEFDKTLPASSPLHKGSKPVPERFSLTSSLYEGSERPNTSGLNQLVSILKKNRIVKSSRSATPYAQSKSTGKRKLESEIEIPAKKKLMFEKPTASPAYLSEIDPLEEISVTDKNELLQNQSDSYYLSPVFSVLDTKNFASNSCSEISEFSRSANVEKGADLVSQTPHLALCNLQAGKVSSKKKNASYSKGLETKEISLTVKKQKSTAPYVRYHTYLPVSGSKSTRKAKLESEMEIPAKTKSMFETPTVSPACPSEIDPLEKISVTDTSEELLQNQSDSYYLSPLFSILDTKGFASSSCSEQRKSSRSANVKKRSDLVSQTPLGGLQIGKVSDKKKNAFHSKGFETKEVSSLNFEKHKSTTPYARYHTSLPVSGSKSTRKAKLESEMEIPAKTKSMFETPTVSPACPSEIDPLEKISVTDTSEELLQNQSDSYYLSPLFSILDTKGFASSSCSEQRKSSRSANVKKRSDLVSQTPLGGLQIGKVSNKKKNAFHSKGFGTKEVSTLNFEKQKSTTPYAQYHISLPVSGSKSTRKAKLESEIEIPAKMKSKFEISTISPACPSETDPLEKISVSDTSEELLRNQSDSYYLSPLFSTLDTKGLASSSCSEQRKSSRSANVKKSSDLVSQTPLGSLQIGIVSSKKKCVFHSNGFETKEVSSLTFEKQKSSTPYARYHTSLPVSGSKSIRKVKLESKMEIPAKKKSKFEKPTTSPVCLSKIDTFEKISATDTHEEFLQTQSDSYYLSPLFSILDIERFASTRAATSNSSSERKESFRSDNVKSGADLVSQTPHHFELDCQEGKVSSKKKNKSLSKGLQMKKVSLTFEKQEPSNTYLESEWPVTFIDSQKDETMGADGSIVCSIKLAKIKRKPALPKVSVEKTMCLRSRSAVLKKLPQKRSNTGRVYKTQELKNKGSKGERLLQTQQGLQNSPKKNSVGKKIAVSRLRCKQNMKGVESKVIDCLKKLSPKSKRNNPKFREQNMPCELAGSVKTGEKVLRKRKVSPKACTVKPLLTRNASQNIKNYHKCSVANDMNIADGLQNDAQNKAFAKYQQKPQNLPNEISAGKMVLRSSKQTMCNLQLAIPDQELTTAQAGPVTKLSTKCLGKNVRKDKSKSTQERQMKENLTLDVSPASLRLSCKPNKKQKGQPTTSLHDSNADIKVLVQSNQEQEYSFKAIAEGKRVLRSKNSSDQKYDKVKFAKSRKTKSENMLSLSMMKDKSETENIHFDGKQMKEKANKSQNRKTAKNKASNWPKTGGNCDSEIIFTKTIAAQPEYLKRVTRATVKRLITV